MTLLVVTTHFFLSTSQFIELIGNKSDFRKSLLETLDWEELKEYVVSFKSGIGASQPRILILNTAKNALLVLDTKRKCRREIAYSEISTVEIPRNKGNMGGETCHMMMKGGANSVRLYFEKEEERIEFCDALRAQYDEIEIKDHSLAGDPDCLRFTIQKINKVGVYKQRVVYIDSKKMVFRSINLDKTYKEVVIKDKDGLNLINIERNPNDKKRLDMNFKNREPLHYVLDSPLERERFLQCCRALTVPTFYSLDVTDKMLFTEKSLINSGLIVPDKKEGGKESHNTDKTQVSDDDGSKESEVMLENEHVSGKNTRPEATLSGATDRTSGESFMEKKKNDKKISIRGLLKAQKIHQSNQSTTVDYGNVKFTPEAVSIFVGSWNVAQNIVYDSLDDFIPSNKFDIYAVGLQECRVKDRSKWEVELTRHINLNYRGNKAKNTHVLVKKCALREINLFLFVKKDLVDKVTNIEAHTVACGIGNVVGNKGGAAISLSLFDSKLCFLTCHLAARSERLDNRRDDYRRICREMGMGVSNLDILSQFHHLFWFGDLNYRVAGEFSDVQNLWKLCKHTGKWDKMRKLDQLNSEIAKGRVFQGFNEGTLTFGPTYRFDKKSNEFSNKNFQNPSWTDRILERSLPGCMLKRKRYYCARNVFGSDHRPVAAVYQFVPLPPVNVLDKERELRLSVLVCDITITDLKVSVMESIEGDAREKTKAEDGKKSKIFSTSANTNKNSEANTRSGHWAENLSKSSDVILRAVFSSTILPADVSSLSKKIAGGASAEENGREISATSGGTPVVVHHTFTWDTVKLAPFIPDESFVRRNYVVVGLTMQTADAQEPLGVCVCVFFF